MTAAFQENHGIATQEAPAAAITGAIVPSVFIPANRLGNVPAGTANWYGGVHCRLPDGRTALALVPWSIDMVPAEIRDAALLPSPQIAFPATVSQGDGGGAGGGGSGTSN